MSPSLPSSESASLPARPIFGTPSQLKAKAGGPAYLGLVGVIHHSLEPIQLSFLLLSPPFSLFLPPFVHHSHLVSYDVSPALIPMEAWPPDATRGFDLPPAQASILRRKRVKKRRGRGIGNGLLTLGNATFPADATTGAIAGAAAGATGDDFSSCGGSSGLVFLAESSIEACADRSEDLMAHCCCRWIEQGGVHSSGSPLLSPPALDFSMPFNVATLTRWRGAGYRAR